MPRPSKPQTTIIPQRKTRRGPQCKVSGCNDRANFSSPNLCGKHGCELAVFHDGYHQGYWDASGQKDSPGSTWEVVAKVYLVKQHEMYDRRKADLREYGPMPRP